MLRISLFGPPNRRKHPERYAKFGIPQLFATLIWPRDQKDAIKNLKNSVRRHPWRRFVSKKSY
jgi:hypothetical protein